MSDFYVSIGRIGSTTDCQTSAASATRSTCTRLASPPARSWSRPSTKWDEIAKAVDLAMIRSTPPKREITL